MMGEKVAGGGQARARARLSREAIVSAGVAIADRDGLEPLTIRALATDMGTKPMSIYRHVANKEALLDAMVDVVIAEMEPAGDDPDWRAALLQRCESARRALVRHPWAIPLLESRRNPGPELLRHHEATLAALARGGLPRPVIAHAYALLDSFVYGFAMQEANLDGADEAHGSEMAGQMRDMLDPEEFPHLLDFVSGHAARDDYSFGDSFEFGISLVLDGIERAAR